MSSDAQKPGYVVHDGCDHIFFIGFLGAGKSTVARNIGHLFHRRFIDTDKLVMQKYRQSVAEIFTEYGEDEFRRRETAVLKTLQHESSLLVSCSGGIVEREENIALMHAMGKIVYLEGDLEDSLMQIQRPENRPDLGDYEHAKKVFAHRKPLYEQACDLTVRITAKDFEAVAMQTAELLWENGLL